MKKVTKACSDLRKAYNWLPFFRGFQVCEEKRSSFFNYNLIEPESGILSLLDITDIYQK